MSKGTPQIVKDTVSRAAAFLQKHIFGFTYQPWNAFFSGSIKGVTVRYHFESIQLNTFIVEQFVSYLIVMNNTPSARAN